jgi:hypothetical protein
LAALDALAKMVANELKTKLKRKLRRKKPRLGKPNAKSVLGNSQSASPSSLIPPDISPIKRALLLYANWSSITLAFSLLIYLLFSNQYSFKRMPFIVGILLLYGFTYCTFMDLSVLQRWVSSPRFGTDPKFTRRVRYLSAFNGILMTTLLYVFLFYISGSIDLLTAFFQAHWPSIQPKVSYYVSTLIGWIVAGILGNAGYDLLKKFGRRMKGHK